MYCLTLMTTTLGPPCVSSVLCPMCVELLGFMWCVRQLSALGAVGIFTLGSAIGSAYSNVLPCKHCQVQIVIGKPLTCFDYAHSPTSRRAFGLQGGTSFSGASQNDRQHEP